jgi:hypothetical protein
VCSQRLTLAERLRQLLVRKPETYPFRAVDGSRREQPVRALCGNCRARAARRRQETAAADEGDAPMRREGSRGPAAPA